MKKFLKQVFTHTGSTNLRDLLQILTNMGVEYDDSILNDLDQLIEEKFIIQAHTNISGIYYRVVGVDNSDSLEQSIAKIMDLLPRQFPNGQEFTTNSLHKAQQDTLGLSKVSIIQIVENLLDQNTIEVSATKKYMGREYKCYRIIGSKKKVKAS